MNLKELSFADLCAMCEYIKTNCDGEDNERELKCLIYKIQDEINLRINLFCNY